MSVQKKIVGWYDGENIKSTIKYYSPKKEIHDKLEFIQFMGHLSANPDDGGAKMSLVIRFKDGSDKWISCEQNEDGSFNENVCEEALKKADAYLESLVV